MLLWFLSRLFANVHSGLGVVTPVLAMTAKDIAGLRGHHIKDILPLPLIDLEMETLAILMQLPSSSVQPKPKLYTN
jgi:hypothetical protein